MAFQNPSDEARKEMLQNAKTIAVVGCSNNPDRTSYMIAEALQHAGYRIIPVNPVIAGQNVLGETVRATLTEIDEQVDIVNVFREVVMPVAEQVVQMKQKPKLFWLQLDIVNEEAADLVKQHGVEVVMNRCIKVDHAILVKR